MEKIISELKKKAPYRDRIEHIEVLPSRKPVYGELNIDLSKEIIAYLLKKKVKLYRHQSDAINILSSGKNIVITTPTASGKTLAFNIPVFEQLNHDRQSRALYLYPAKALSHDQLKVIREIETISGIDLNSNVYDGDTPRDIRPSIRENSRLIISNPYELHHILPWHSKWRNFYRNLDFVVIDEAHQYRGVMGSNVAYLLRRFRRICRHYGSNPRFILSTATLANPIEFAEKLTGLPFELIDRDGSPKGKKYFIFYNPYADGTGTISVHRETESLCFFFLEHNLQTLCFTISRKMAELIAHWIKNDRIDRKFSESITAYRAGYLPEERRDIENRLKSGELRGVISTNALELGIDIGTLDCVVISGYPGTIISTWQQAGRAGRGLEASAVTLVAFQNPLDQYFMKHPAYFFDKPHEHAIIDLENPYIIEGHMLCASYELPLNPLKDILYFRDKFKDFSEKLEDMGLLRKMSYGLVYNGKVRPVENVSLNSISSTVFKVFCDGKLLETMDRAQAYREGHEGSVMLHQGETYRVRKLDLEKCHIYVNRKDLDYHTEVIKEVDLKILREINSKKSGHVHIFFGEVEVKEYYTGYKIKKYDSMAGVKDLDLPPLLFKTMSLWFTIPEQVKRKIEIFDFEGGLHGAEHAMIGVMPFHVMCDRWDIGGLSTAWHADTDCGTIFIYDGFEGGIGLSEKAFQLIHEIVKMTFELVKDCPCEEGCPACIYSPKCGNENETLNKKASELLLKNFLT
jgi:DEAD/DEAH box helicase domain-containing protein